MSKNNNFKNIIKSIGPGILFAGAAIGGSHLIQSTRAGANYGLDLIILVVLINLFKYPFFEYGHRYVTATGESLLHGYMKLGRWAVLTFFILNIVTAIVNAAAVTIVTAGLTAHIFNINFSPAFISFVILTITMTILFIGHYSWLDLIMKVMVSLLALTTIITVGVAMGIFNSNARELVEVTKPDLFDAAGIGFLLALMGWMPAPIETSVWPSLWALERSKQTNYKPKMKEALIDFHIGYIGTTIMAVFFVCLGAFIMYGSGETFANSGVTFSAQLVALYTKTIGEWSEYVIGSIVLITMISTTLTVFDAYPRTLSGLIQIISKRAQPHPKRLYWATGIVMAFAGIIIIEFFTSGMKSLLDLATIISFLAAPVFAVINYKVVTSDSMPAEFRPAKWLKILSWLGIVFFICFSLLFIASKIFI